MREISVVQDEDENGNITGLFIRVKTVGDLMDYFAWMGNPKESNSSSQMWAARMRDRDCTDEEIEEARRQLNLEVERLKAS